MDDQAPLEQNKYQSTPPVNQKPNRKFLRWSLLVLAVVLLMAGTAFGVYQYQKSQSDDKEAKLNSQIADLRSQVNKLNNASKTQNVNPEEDTQDYMVIKQWSVKVPLSQETDGLTYSIDKNGVASFRTSSLNAIASACTSNSVNVARGTASQVVPNETGSSGGDTFKKAYDATAVDPAQLTTRSIKNMIADYYYVVPGYAGASCATGQQSQTTETNAKLAIVKAVNAMVAN